jgi:protein phosphatase
VVETMCAAMLDGLSAPESLVPALDLCARLLQQRARATVTLAGVIFAEEAARVVHIGHARCYRLGGGALARLTVDHTFGAQCVREQLMTPEQAARSPHRRLLTRALGAADSEVESATFEIAAGDILVLATQGLYGFVADSAIEAILRADDDPERAAVRLALAAADAGSPFDVTAVVAKAR